jgi:uncharacterized protein YfaS (alpha-2-macroglobulin family)
VRAAAKSIAHAFSKIAGEWTWKRPAWIKSANRSSREILVRIRREPRQSLLIAGSVVVVAGAAWLGWHWYDALPKPVEIEFTVHAPQRTCYECEPPGAPNPLIVRFGDSVAPLADAGHPLEPTRGLIEMSPSFDGEWRWDDDRTLRFVPAGDWPIGVVYSVSFARKGFAADHVRLAEQDFEFTSPAFTATIESTEFYQDPVKAGDKKIVAAFRFSHPVSPGELEQLVQIRLFNRISKDREEEVKPAPGFTVTYDKLALRVFVHSANLDVPAKEGRVELTLVPGLRSARGGNRLEEPLNARVTVPGLYSLAVSELRARIVRDERDEPSQTLFVATTHSVTEPEMAGHIKAWVLPEKHPDPKIQENWESANLRKPFRWFGKDQISATVLEAARPLALDQVPGEMEHSELHGFRFEADAGRDIYVRVESRLKSFGGFLMPEPADALLQVPAYPRELRITHRGSLLALSGQRKLTLFARGIPAIRIQVGRLLPNQLQHLVTQTSEVYDRPQFRNWNFDEKNLVEVFTDVVRLPALDPREPQYTTLDVGRYLNREGAGRQGIFLLTVEAWDPVKSRVIHPDYSGCGFDCDTAVTTTDKRLVVVTDLGLLVKKALDGSQDVFLQSVTSGDPVAGATVEVIGRNGEPVRSAVTDATGHLRFGDLRSLEREQQPALYLARLGGDSTFLPIEGNLRPLDLSRFDVGGLTDVVDRARLTAFLFSDRGLYRPGDEIRAAAIVKTQDWRPLPAGVPLRVEVMDPRGIAVKRETMKLSAGGMEEIRYRTAATAPAGMYTLNVSVLKERDRQELIGSTTVSVREFLPDRLRLRTRFSKESTGGWVPPDGLKAEVELENLFGTPAAARRLTATMRLTPALPVFPAYRDFTFRDPQAAREGFTETLGDSQTDDAGKGTFELDLRRFARATYRISLLVEGFEADGGRGVTAETSQLVSNLPFLVGWKADGGLDYVARAAPRRVEFVAIDPAARKTEAAGLKLRHVERRYLSMLIRQDSGVYKYQSRLKEVPISEQPFAIGESGAAIALETATPGRFSEVLVDEAGQVYARVDYTVAGAANLTRSLERNAELEITLDRQDYSPGDEIELSIRAPYTGAGLITIERDRVYAWRWFRSTTTSSVQRIRLPPGIEGNAYVNVTFVRDPASEEIFTSPLSWGVQPFSIALDARRNTVTLDAPELAKPGQALRVGYSTERPARLVLFAVDEGILQVARYRTPDPLGHFFAKRALNVTTQQILDLLLPEFRDAMLSAPGGDEDAGLANRLNPFQRKTEPPVAWWSGVIEAGPQARHIEIPVPDYFNGTLKVMAVAVADDTVGAADTRSVVRGDFVLSPNAPLTVTPGDEFEVNVGVANNVAGSGPEASVVVGVTASRALEVLGNREVTLAIGEMREGSARFRVRAGDALGSASLTFSARTAGKTGRRETTLSVRPATPHMAKLTAGSFRGRADVPVSRSMYSEYRRLRAGVSTLPLALAHGLRSYLGQYAYTCTEQVVSQAMPAIVLAERPEFGQVNADKGVSLEGLIDELRMRQDGRGAYRYWPGGVEVVEFVSIYTQHVLLEAAERGQPVPGDLVLAGNEYLRALAARDADDMAGERTTVYAIYLLARQGQRVTNETAALQKRLEERYAKVWRKDIAAAYLAAAYRLQRQDALAERAIAGVDPVGEHDYDQWHDPMTSDAELLYLLARHFPERLVRLPEAFLDTMVRRVSNNEYHSLSAATTILALDAYATTAGPVVTPELGIKAMLADKSARDLQLPAGLFPSAVFPAEARTLRFAGPDELRAFYLVDESGFDRKPPAGALVQGLEILREYLDDAGKPVTRVRLGDQVTVRVKFRAVNRDAVQDAVIVDLLPGGFDLVVPSQAPAEQRHYSASVTEDAPGESDRHDLCRCLFLYERPQGFPAFADLREDRVVLYGIASTDLQMYSYRIKATNAGSFVIPPALGEAMYDPRVRARSAAGRISVERP